MKIRLYYIFLSLCVNVCISFCGTILTINYLEDQKTVVEVNKTAEVGYAQNIHCFGGGSFERVGYFKEKVGFICQNQILHQEKLTKEFRTLIDVTSGLDMTNRNLSIVERYLGDGNWQMVEVWITDNSLLAQENCPFTKSTVMGKCLSHILIWRREGFYPFPTGSANNSQETEIIKS